MARLIANDITDELVKPVVTQADLDAANDYLDDLARSQDGDYTIDDIPTPLPYKVKRLVVAFVCREVCARKSGGGGMAFKGQDSSDKWTTKLPFWATEVRNLEGQMTIEVLTGKKTSASVGQITLERA